MKDGLFFEDGELVYYSKGEPEHAGVVKIDGDIYYISSRGRAVRGEYVVHGEMTNGILKRGTYTFGDDYKLVKGSYVAPRKRKRPAPKTGKFPVVPVVVTASVLLAALAVTVLVDVMIERKPEEPLPTSRGEVGVKLPTFTEDVLLCSDAAKKLYDGEMSLETAIATGDPYEAFVFDYDLKGRAGVLSLSENTDLSDAREFTLEADKRELTIDNLKTGTTYYYKVTVEGEEYLGSFHTAASTRFLSIPGVANIRDVGGYVNQDGKTVNQDLLIRGVEIDGLAAPEYYIPNKDLAGVQETFGFVYEMDLRRPSVSTGTYLSRLGADVGHEFYAAPQYAQIFNSDYLPALRNIFTDLADPAKYPMYLHCTWGTDRTGTVVFLLQGVLNMSDEDMIREYQLTGFVDPKVAEHHGIQAIIDGLEEYEGDTLSEKVVTYLTTVAGIPEEELDSIRNILLSE